MEFPRGICQYCGRQIAMTAKSRVIRAHQLDGQRCPGSAKEPEEVTFEPQAALTQAGEKPSAPGGDLDSGAGEPDSNELTRNEKMGWLMSLVVVLALVGVWIFNTVQTGRRMDAAVAYTCNAYLEAARTKNGSADFRSPDTKGLDLVELSHRIDDACDEARRKWQEATPDRHGGSVSGDGTISNGLQSAGVTASDVGTLASVGRQTGYLPAGATQSVVDSFAYMAVLECRDVRSGSLTWGDSTARAIASGAAPADAQQFVSHLRSSFCPKVK